MPLFENLIAPPHIFDVWTINGYNFLDNILITSKKKEYVY